MSTEISRKTRNFNSFIYFMKNSESSARFLQIHPSLQGSKKQSCLELTPWARCTWLSKDFPNRQFSTSALCSTRSSRLSIICRSRIFSFRESLNRVFTRAWNSSKRRAICCAKRLMAGPTSKCRTKYVLIQIPCSLETLATWLELDACKVPSYQFSKFWRMTCAPVNLDCLWEQFNSA